MSRWRKGRSLLVTAIALAISVSALVSGGLEGLVKAATAAILFAIAIVLDEIEGWRPL